MLNLFRSALVLACIFSTAAAPASAQAQRVRAGKLVCDAAPRVGLVLGSRQDLRCVFRSDLTGRRYVYAGAIRRIGVDFGITRGGQLSWTVFAPAMQVGRNSLRGSYVGASGNVALGVGLGAKLLIGGFRRTIMLQPLSIAGQIGFSAALGVTDLSLH